MKLLGLQSDNKLNFHLHIRQKQLFFVVRAVKRIISARSLAKIILIILSSVSAHLKIKNADHRAKETYPIRSIQVTYETGHIS